MEMWMDSQVLELGLSSGLQGGSTNYTRYVVSLMTYRAVLMLYDYVPCM